MPAHRRRAARRSQTRREVGSGLPEHLVERAGERRRAPADPGGVVRGAAHPDACLAVIGGEHAGEAPVGHEELVALPPGPGVVGVVGGAVGVPGHIDRRVDRPGHAGAQPVGADDEPGVELERGASCVQGGHADHPATIVAEAGHGDAEADGRSRGLSGVGDDGVQHASAGSDQGVHAGVLLDRARHRLTPDVEGHLADRGGAAGEHPIEQAPAGKLDDAATRDGVRRQRVARELGALQHDHVVAHPCQEQRGGAPRRTCPDHDDVMAAVGAGVHRDRLLLVARPLALRL